jgi:hypothetical protein
MDTGPLHISTLSRKDPAGDFRCKLSSGVGRQFLPWTGLLAFLLLGGLSFWVAAGLLPFGLSAFVFASRIGYRAWVGWPLALAGLLGIQCVLGTAPSVRQHDVEGHREYVEFVVQNGKIPPVLKGWETWQPPLYYFIAAGWRRLFAGAPQDDLFRSVQFLSALLYIATVTGALAGFRWLRFSDVEAVAGVGLLTCIPGYVFFAARINNDVLLPLLGGGILVFTTKIIEKSDPTTRGTNCLWSICLALLLVACLATKGSSLAIVGGALVLMFWSELHLRVGWKSAMLRTYFIGLPSGLWLLFWFTRNSIQTGDPLYVNSALPEELRVLVPPLQRLLSFEAGAFLGGSFYNDEPIRDSYFTAVLTSLLYGEYGMGGYGFRVPVLLRLGAFGLMAVLVLGSVFPPRRGLRASWLACLALAACQFVITVLYALKFPYSCNQNARFFAQAFVPFAGLFGIGAGRLWNQSGRFGRVALVIIAAVVMAGLADFYFQLLL